MKPKFSVIIPVYNAEKYIKRSISSVVNQTYKNIEIILIDDGSQDKSRDICEEYSKNDNRIKVIYQKNSGVSVSRNVGIKNSIAPYIIFVDSDDWIENNMLEKLNKITEEMDVDCITYNINNIVKTGCISVKKMIKDFIKLIKTETINSSCNKVYKREIIEKYDVKFDKKIQIGEDLLFNLLYLSKIEDIYFLNENLYNYNRENVNSVTAKYIENKYEQLMYVDSEIKKYLQSFDNKKLLECEKFVRFKNIFSCFMDLSHKECKYTRKEKINYIKKIRKENRIIIKRLGTKLLFASLIYLTIPSGILLVISKKFFKRKIKNIR